MTRQSPRPNPKGNGEGSLCLEVHATVINARRALRGQTLGVEEGHGKIRCQVSDPAEGR